MLDGKICEHKLITRIIYRRKFTMQTLILTKIIFAQKITEQFDIFRNSFNLLTIA